jgi:hypothetical protein
VLPALLVSILAPLVVPRWLDSRRHWCPASLRNTMPSLNDVVPGEQLRSVLPDTVAEPLLDASGESALDVHGAASLDRDADVGEALLANRFLNGYLRTWSHPVVDRPIVINVFVLQFADAAGATSYEAWQQVRLCRTGAKPNALTATPGTWRQELTLGDRRWTRLVLLRGPRAYYVYLYVKAGTPSPPSIESLTGLLGTTAQ